MIGLATGRYTILRGTVSTNDYGDEVSTDGVLKTGVLGSVIEKSRQDFDPQSSRVVTLRTLTGRFGHGTDVTDGDRIKDEKTGVTYLVNSVTHSTALVNKPDVVVDLSVN
jgi:hypothetical protein